MNKISALVISGYGTNSHMESAHAARLGGADKADVVHFSDIVAGDVQLSEYQLLIFPGGFLDGDDLGAAQAAAQRWRYVKDATGRPLLESLISFIKRGGLVLGICNGFQLLVKLGILPALDGNLLERQVSLGHNGSARYEDRWIELVANPASPCVFTKNITSSTGLLPMPVRHGEGKLVARDETVLARLMSENLVALQYANPTTGDPTQQYPHNPNGSPLAIAGLTDPTGRVLGLMPHPEAFHHPTNHPGWTRGEKAVPGTALFVNAVNYLREHPMSAS